MVVLKGERKKVGGIILIPYPDSEGESARMRELMNQYRNVPMDLADAHLVAAAEVLNVTRIFSTDSEFYMYRLRGNTHLKLIYTIWRPVVSLPSPAPRTSGGMGAPNLDEAAMSGPASGVISRAPRWKVR